jgi:hypothetical protein
LVIEAVKVTGALEFVFKAVQLVRSAEDSSTYTTFETLATWMSNDALFVSVPAEMVSVGSELVGTVKEKFVHGDGGAGNGNEGAAQSVRL